jgi:hypothetical protein
MYAFASFPWPNRRNSQGRRDLESAALPMDYISNQTGHQVDGISLSTPPLTVGTSLDCIAANIGTTPVTLNIELHDMNGEVAFNQTCKLPPGAVNAGGSQCSIIEGAPLFVGYCTFKVTNGSKQDIRAAILSQDVNLGTGGLSAALPAQ